jgi:O-6-methylguanine DNA methyltransferase
MSTKANVVMFELPILTADGEFSAWYSDKGLCGLNFPGRRPQTPVTPEPPAQVRDWHRATTQALTDVLAGRQPADLPPLDLSVGTDFQQKVWAALLRIRSGETLSYGGVAQAIGKPKALRAVGQACGANPIPVLIPCHRVLAAHQRLGGFSSDPKWKRILLGREQIQIQE